MRSPARKPCFRAPYPREAAGVTSGEVDSYSPALKIQQVTILDDLLGRELVINVNQSHTVNYLKTRIQSRQGQDGLRIIPAHIQRLTFQGQECHDEDTVCSIMRGSMAPPLFVVEPRVNELVSFFLASVSNLAGPGRSPKAANQLSPTTSCADATFGQAVSHFSLDVGGNGGGGDGDSTLFFGEAMEGVEDEIARTPSTPSSPRSMSSPAAPLSPVVGNGFGSPMEPPLASAERRRRLAAFHQLKVDVAGSPDSMSAKATPIFGTPFGEDGGLVGLSSCSYEGISCINQVMQLAHCASASHGPKASALLKRNGLDATLLREVDKGNYSSQSHIIFRDRASCMQQLALPKLKAMEQIVLEIQSGLRHGHLPEELSTSGRDTTRDSASSSAQLSLTDSWERERASWWQQQVLTRTCEINGHVTDFDYGELVPNCCGGTYLMRNSRGAQAAVFKPTDEEPYAPENPKGFTGLMDVDSEMKAGVVVGGGAARECAAFLLDHQGVGSVPCTAMLRIAHTTLLADSEAEVQIKVGSLQRFQQHDCTAEDVGTARFDLTQSHAIGVLDVRTFNKDRNSDNVLVKFASTSMGMVQLVPIDHGYILPSYKHLEDVHVCWLHWPQAKTPYSEEMLEYISNLDAEADMALLRSTLALPEDCLLTLFIGTTLIKMAASHGLTLHETGMLMVRECLDRPSAVEQVVAEAVFLADSLGLDRASDDFYSTIKLHLQELLGQLVLAHQME